MKKYIIGVLFGLILALTTGTILSSRIQTQNDIFYYEKLNFDFIIPKPWYSQVQELKTYSFVEDVVPFYLWERSFTSNDARTDVDVYLIEADSDENKTPFSSRLLLAGTSLSDNGIVIDSRTSDILKVSVGDSVAAVFGSYTVQFVVCGIVQRNLFSNKPTAVVYYTGDVKRGIEQTIQNLAYSGAYVKVNAIDVAEEYFNTAYRALGLVGERSWYKDDTSYEYMFDSISQINVEKEITNVPSLRANTLSQFKGARKHNIQVMTCSVISDFVLLIVFWLIFLLVTSRSYRARIKKGTNVEKVLREFLISEFLSVFFFALILILFHGLYTSLPFICSIIISMGILFIVTKKIIIRR